ncbi:MAG: DegV family EDD domain-containing protein [Cellulomonas sp.]|nr:DegV family EDD domain-containing protein [Cellulomonas sp.]
MTDSTACLPSGLARSHQVSVVPLDVVVDGARSLDGELAPADLLAALESGARVSTSQPPPAAFAAVYARAVADGATDIVSVHLSGGLSGTVSAARAAAAACEVPVVVVDSGSAAMGLGFAVLAAARAARAEPVGAPAARPRWRRWRRVPAPVARPVPTPEEIAELAARTATAGSVWFLVDSLDHLRRGGRLSAASAVLGTLLALHPLLTLTGGRLTVAAKVRTRRAARARLEQLAVDAVLARGSARVAVHHLGREADACDLADSIVARTQECVVEVVVAPAGAVLAAHVGPGLLAVVVTGLAAEQPSGGPAIDPTSAPGSIDLPSFGRSAERRRS